MTASYPFGEQSESFLENEIPILANRFEQVLILPSHRKEGRRSLPDGVELVEMDWLDGWDRMSRFQGLANRAAFQVLGSVVASPREWLAYVRGLRTYGEVLAQSVLKARELGSFIEARGLERALFYDYWFENSTLTLAILRVSGRIAAAVARAHGFDLYDERWLPGRVPFRDFKANGLDRIFPVSEFGRRYLVDKIPWASARVEVHRLGVPQQCAPAPVEREAPLVVSCGALLPFKRFDAIPEVLALLRRPVRWVHFGDGPDRHRVRAKAARLPKRVCWELRGNVPNSEVIRFYEREPIDAFISLSLSEGLPVSMMEAISFGIPLLAMQTHGIPEIVTEETGISLPVGTSPAEAARALAEVLTPGRFDRSVIREFYTKNYEANANYNAFADALIAVWESCLTS